MLKLWAVVLAVWLEAVPIIWSPPSLIDHINMKRALGSLRREDIVMLSIHTADCLVVGLFGIDDTCHLLVLQPKVDWLVLSSSTCLQKTYSLISGLMNPVVDGGVV